MLDTLEYIVSMAPLDGKSATTHNLGNHACIKLEITFSIPVQVHVKLDTLLRGSVDVDVRKLERLMSKVGLDKFQVGQRTW